MRRFSMWTLAWLLAVQFVSGLAMPAQGQGPPDLTKNPTVDRKLTYNLGATGLRGWIHTKAASNIDSQQGRTTAAARQILVTHVGSDSPAHGVIRVGDVILGAGGKPFDDDARKQMALAIQLAETESSGGTLKLTRWRKGETAEVLLKLRVLGSYSPTAPFDCPKSKRIFEEACRVLEQEPLEENLWGAVNGLALMATGNAEYLPRVREFARKIGPRDLRLQLKPGMVVWEWGYRNLFLCEYYLLTGDAEVLPAIREYTLALAKGQSMYGTFGHGISGRTAEGKLHGSIPPYGPVNAAGLVGNLAIVMGKKCGVKDPEIEPAIERASRFFGYFVDKGAIPYGEHMPWPSHENNGKNAMTAMLFALQGNRIPETKFFAQMVTASYNNREYGHTGQGFSYLWGALGANTGGPVAAAAFFRESSWHFDLVRRCDGSFTYDGGEQYGPGETEDNTYFGKSSYYGLSPAATYVLTYALPLKKICLTGRDANPENWLSPPEVESSVASGRFDLERKSLTADAVLTAFGDWSPVVRSWAAEELSSRPDLAGLTPELFRLAGEKDPHLRQSACETLGRLQAIESLPILVQNLSHPHRWVRFKAAEAIGRFGKDAAPVLPDILRAIAETAEPLQPINWDDPIQLVHGQLAEAVFEGPLSESLKDVDTSLLYPAIRAIASNADGMARAKLRRFFENKLTLEDVQALAPDIYAAVKFPSPADTMFGNEIRMGGFMALAKYNFREAIELGVLFAKTQGGHGSENRTGEIMREVARFGSAAKDAIPEMKELIADFNAQCQRGEFPGGELNDRRVSAVQSAIDAIESATTHPELRSVENPGTGPSSDQSLPYSGSGLPPQDPASSGAVETPSSGFTHRKNLELEGWTVMVSEQLLKQDNQATDRALELLTKQLREINEVVPPAAVVELHRVPLWISPEYPDVPPRAEYHPGAGWLRDNNRDPAMEKGVEFTNVRIFEQETRRMPNFALHELAHAYHDRVLSDGFDNKAIKVAFRRAKDAGLYDNVEQRFGDGRSASVRAYALTNPQEYFAECTEAFFSTNDFFPFTRDQLAKYDPGMFQVLKELWGETANRETAAEPSIQDADQLTLDRIFVSDDFRPDPLPPRKWLENGSFITLSPSATWKNASDLVRVDKAGTKEVLVPAENLVPRNSDKPLVVEGFEFSPDLDVVLVYTNSVKVWRQNTRGDYWTFRRSTKKLTQLGGEALPSTLMFAKLSPDGTRVGYVRENNLYVESAEGGSATAIASDGSTEIINGTFDWVYEEEFDCRDGWRWSPDGQQIAYWQLNTAGVKTFTLVDYTTDSYPILKTFAYPKTGEQNSACRIGVVAATGGTTNWINIPGDTRTDFYLPRMEWADNSQELVVQRVHRIQNTVDVMLADAKSGTVRIALTERDEAWVDLHDGIVEWTENGNSFSWISERDGWRHLYLASRDGTTIRQITRGRFDVIRVLGINEKTGKALILASPQNPTQQYLYSVSLDGTGEPRRISPADQPGTHEYDVSPDGMVAVHTWSNIDHPPQVELVSLPDHKPLYTIAANDRLRQAVGALKLPPVEFLQTDIGGDEKLDGWLIKPPDFDPSKKYPLILHVYGEPASQTVKDLWGGRHFLWHRMLAQQGYVVACFDNRGTPCPRGRAWRKAAFKCVGTLASTDQAAATRELLKQPWLDSSRVGVWGWSGGGSMTLNLMFRYPEIFQTGIAVASVPDMRLYDTIYQERYMGLPQENVEAYADGSPITHAAGLKGNLMIVHGSGDDNCHEQGMNKLVNRLIELNRDFSMMSYPNRSHSINEGANTTRHLYGLMTRYLNGNLPAGAK